MAPQRSMAKIVKTEHFKTVSSFLRALHPSDRRWQPNPECWIFRGHAKAAWPLLPAAFRSDPWVQFGGLDPTTCNEGIRTATERLFLREFGDSLDRVGLAVPGITRAALDGLLPESGVSPQWPLECLDLAALAQHHGIPTRLLDFTWHAFVAAYFAAQPVAGVARDLCVWALDGNFLQHGRRCDGIWFALAKVSRASNPNLHAQAGVFVVWTGPNQLMSLDAIVRRVAHGRIKLSSGRLFLRPPVMRKLILPRRHARNLLRELVLERITGATMYPGVDGVVRELRERTLHGRFQVRL